MATVTDELLKQIPSPKNTMVVARGDGRLYLVDFSEYAQADDAGAIDWNLSVSKILMSKIQQSRNNLQTLEGIEIENITHSNQPPTGELEDTLITVFGSLDGKNNDLTVNPTIVEDEGGFIKAACRVTARNFAIQLRGVYDLNTFQVIFHPAGRR